MKSTWGWGEEKDPEEFYPAKSPIWFYWTYKMVRLVNYLTRGVR